MSIEVAYIGIGSNIGDRLSYCLQAVRMIRSFRQSEVKKVSSFYETDPVGNENQNSFFNAVVEIETKLRPEDLLRACQHAERNLGRKRIYRYGPRTMDLDILFYGNRVIETKNLTVPHPRLHERRFVLIPLCEIAPNLIHPGQRKPIKDLLSRSTDRKTVRCLTVDLDKKTG